MNTTTTSAGSTRAWGDDGPLARGRRLLLMLAMIAALTAAPTAAARAGDAEKDRDRPVAMGISVPLPPPS